jgi:diguanylate cyclase (GGDEF)-like protein
MVNESPEDRTRWREWCAALGAFLGIGVVGAVDFLTGVEYRIYPLYFLPLSLAAWYLGRPAALTAAIFSACAWLGSNYMAGLRFSQPNAWIVNFLTQTAAFIVVAMLIATLKRGVTRERLLSRIDPLTSLLNGRAFYHEARRILELSRRYGHAVTLAYVDLDDFKSINDTLGHARGDDVLRRAGGVLTRSVRKSDLTARVGGDEFVVLLAETGPDRAAFVLERLRTLFAETVGATAGAVTVSVGAVSFTASPVDVDELLQRADAALYTAKTAGKNHVTVEVVDRPRQIH